MSKSAVTAMIAGVAMVVAISGCSGSDAKSGTNSNANKLVGQATISPQAEKAPFKAAFNYKVQQSAGPVKVKWNFADGTTSDKLSGTHEFKKPDFYAVGVEATDAKGHEDNWNLVVRAHDPKTPDVSQLPKDPAKRADAMRDQIKQTVLLYYTKYPTALASDPNSDFYKTYPYLRPLYKKHQALLKKREQVQKAAGKKAKQEGEAN